MGNMVVTGWRMKESRVKYKQSSTHCCVGVEQVAAFCNTFIISLQAWVYCYVIHTWNLPNYPLNVLRHCGLNVQCLPWSLMFELLVPSRWHYIVKPLGSGVSSEEVGLWGQDLSLGRSSLTVRSGESELSTLQGFLTLCFGSAHDVSSCFYWLNFPTMVNCTFELGARINLFSWSCFGAGVLQWQ